MNILKIALTLFLIISFAFIIYAWYLLQSLSLNDFFIITGKIFATLLIGILIFVLAALLLTLLLLKNK